LKQVIAAAAFEFHKGSQDQPASEPRTAPESQNISQRAHAAGETRK
jgi:hypothetical protein